MRLNHRIDSSFIDILHVGVPLLLEIAKHSVQLPSLVMKGPFDSRQNIQKQNQLLSFK